jgi:hypothetical protein
MRGQVEIEVKGFLVQAGSKTAIVRVDTDAQVKEVNGWFARGEFPSQSAEWSGFLEGRPKGFISLWVRVGDPGSNAIVNVLVVKAELVAEGREQGIHFVDTIIYRNIGRGGWGTHGCTLDLVPGGVSKAKVAISHYYFKRSEDGCMVVADSLTGKVARDAIKGMGHIDVSIHRDGIHGEEASAGRESTGRKLE